MQFADGAFAFRKVATDLGLRGFDVIHADMQFSKDLIDPVTGKHEIAGTQTLERYWDHLDLYVPRSIRGAVLH